MGVVNTGLGVRPPRFALCLCYFLDSVLQLLHLWNGKNDNIVHISWCCIEGEMRECLQIWQQERGRRLQWERLGGWGDGHSPSRMLDGTRGLGMQAPFVGMAGQRNLRLEGSFMSGHSYSWGYSLALIFGPISFFHFLHQSLAFIRAHVTTLCEHSWCHFLVRGQKGTLEMEHWERIQSTPPFSHFLKISFLLSLQSDKRGCLIAEHNVREYILFRLP